MAGRTIVRSSAATTNVFTPADSTVSASQPERESTRLTAMLQDLRYALRTLLKSPTYSLIALLALGLCIGAKAAIFSFVDAMLLRPLPYANADRLYAPIGMNPSRGSERASITFA